MPVAIASRAFPGESHCGDQAGYWRNGRQTTLCIVDGLGHGRYAAAAAKMAISYVADHLAEPLPDLFAGCNAALRHSRGVAMGVAVVNEAAGTVTYAGIGNTRALIVTRRKPAALSGRPGIVGGGYKKLRPETRPLASGDRLFLFSDGLPEMIDFARYPAAVWADGQRLVGKLIAEWGRETDDTAVLLFSISKAIS